MIHGYILTAWAAAGICGPTLVATLLHHTGSYEKAFMMFICMLFIALFISLHMMRRVAALKSKKIMLAREI